VFVQELDRHEQKTLVRPDWPHETDQTWIRAGVLRDVPRIAQDSIHEHEAELRSRRSPLQDMPQPFFRDEDAPLPPDAAGQDKPIWDLPRHARPRSLHESTVGGPAPRQ
jgi:hypothetical protein